MLGVSILGLVLSVIIKLRKLKLFRGHLFLNAVKIMLFISDTKFYVTIKLCKMAGSFQLSKITGTLNPENVKLKRNKILDIREIDWKKVNMTSIGNKINLPKSGTIKFRDKFQIGCLVKREPLLFHIMSK